MLRQGLLWLSQQNSIFKLLRTNPLARKFASRFVAGETIEQAVDAARQLAGSGIGTTLDLLGESVHEAEDARLARDEYLRMLQLLADAPGVDDNVSVKLTQMGLDIDPALCAANVRAIVQKAADVGGFVRLDMESSEYTQRTLDFFYEHLLPTFRANSGVVIQSCLRRSAADVERLIEAGARVRLCKGAYLEPPAVAFPDKADVDRNYVRLMEELLERGNYPGIATHDAAIIDHARTFIAQKGLTPDRYEFQMLYGVRRDLQLALRRDGHRVRVYIPFGTQWYPYLMRRLAERPANIAFMLGNIAKESVSRQ